MSNGNLQPLKKPECWRMLLQKGDKKRELDLMPNRHCGGLSLTFKEPKKREKSVST